MSNINEINIDNGLHDVTPTKKKRKTRQNKFEGFPYKGWLDANPADTLTSEAVNGDKIILADSSVLCHLILQKMSAASIFRGREILVAGDYPTIKLIVSAYMAHFIGGHFWGSRLPVIFLRDDPTRGYWRTKILSEFGIAYKGTRAKHRERSAVTGLGMVLSAVEYFLKKHNVPTIMLPGFEADDLAAAMVYRFKNQEFELFTIDSDWVGLVSDRVNWNNFTRQALTRVTMQNHRGIGKEWTRWNGYKLPADIWHYKAAHGDTADNLPKGTPIGLIHLLNPIVTPLHNHAEAFDAVINSQYIPTVNPLMFLRSKGLMQIGFDNLTFERSNVQY